MWKALSQGFGFAVMIIVLKLFLPEVADSVIVLTTKVLSVLTNAVDSASVNL